MGAKAPLAGLLTLTTDSPTTVEFEVVGEGERWLVSTDEASKNHSIPVLGLLPNANFTISNLKAYGPDEHTQIFADNLQLSTPKLPDDFPEVQILARSRSGNDYTFVPWLQREGGTIQTGGRVTQNYAFVLDASGAVRWYTRNRMNTARQLPNGSLLGQYSGQLAEVDLLGNVVESWHPKSRLNPIEGGVTVDDAGNWHHDHVPLPNGNFLTFSRDEQLVEDFFTSDRDPDAPRAAANVSYDPLIEFMPDGTVVHRWNFLDILDSDRIGYGSLRGKTALITGHITTVQYMTTEMTR